MARKRERPAYQPPPEGSCASKIGCDVGELFRVLGKTHMLDILWTFVRDSPNPRRFVEVQHELGLSPNTLSTRLKDLVEAGLLSRVVYNEIPPRVDYTATQKTLDLGPVFGALHEWAQQHDLQPVPEQQAGAAVA